MTKRNRIPINENKTVLGSVLGLEKCTSYSVAERYKFENDLVDTFRDSSGGFPKSYDPQTCEGMNQIRTKIYALGFIIYESSDCVEVPGSLFPVCGEELYFHIPTQEVADLQKLVTVSSKRKQTKPSSFDVAENPRTEKEIKLSASGLLPSLRVPPISAPVRSHSSLTAGIPISGCRFLASSPLDYACSRTAPPSSCSNDQVCTYVLDFEIYIL